MNKNSMLYWYPKIKNLDIPMPETEIIKLTSKEIKDYERGEGDCFNLDRLEKEVSKIIDSKFELPVFIRTDEISNKHFWKMSCYLDNKKNIKSNLMEIISGSRLADMFGLSIQAIAVREYIPMDTRFYAFVGEMPVNPERRYFIRDGNVECHHPYWIEDAVERGTPAEKLPKNWRQLAKEMNTETKKEVKLLTGYSKKVSEAIEGYWSVDFCRAKKGDWYLIDMAEAEKSWHPSSCKHSNMPEEKPAEKPDFSFLIEKKK